MMNVFNSAFDIPMVFGFFDTYFTNEFYMQQEIDNAHKTIGALAAAKYWHRKIHLTPDSTMTLIKAHVINSEDLTQNRIEITINYKGTRSLIVPPNIPTLLHHNLNQISHHSNINELYEEIKQDSDDFISPFLNSHNPMYAECEGILTLFTDCNNCINRIVLRNWSVISLKSVSV